MENVKLESPEDPYSRILLSSSKKIDLICEKAKKLKNDDQRRV